MSPGQAHYIVLTLTRSGRKEAQRSQLSCPKSCSQLAWWLGFKLGSLIPKPILGTILLASTGTWLVSWRAGCSNITTAMIIWLSDLYENFSIWPWSSRVLSEAHMDHSSAFGTKLCNKVIHVQEKAQHPCLETQGLGLPGKPHSGKTSISSHSGLLAGDHSPSGLLAGDLRLIVFLAQPCSYFHAREPSPNPLLFRPC